jgi:nucleotide-binding universal stress UspA family protein
MKKMLLAVDDSKGAMKAVEYVCDQFCGVPDVEIVLIHVLPNLPAIFWDEGHILSAEEKKERQKVVDLWVARQKLKIEPILRSAVEKIVKKGIRPEQVTTKFLVGATDVALSILDEARESGHRTIVMGRRGLSGIKNAIMGSVTNKVIHLGTGMAIVVVE